MRKIILLLVLIEMLAMPVKAMDYTAPTVPESGKQYLDAEPESFGEGLLKVISKAMSALYPAVKQGAGVCVQLIGILLLVSLVRVWPGAVGRTVNLVSCLLIGAVLLGNTGTMINLGTQTVAELTDYGKLLFPVMAGAMAAQGAVSGSAALFTGTVALNTVLGVLINSIVVPLIFVYIAMALAGCATEDGMLEKGKKFIKWILTWSLKILLYVFTGYLGITGVVSGAADAAAVKAAKITISGVVPLVGGILSDASETILVTAGVMKSAVGVYGMLAFLAVWIGPFLRIGIQYLMLKATSGICDVFGNKSANNLIRDFTSGMGVLLAATGTVCLLLLISTFCMMKGIG